MAVLRGQTIASELSESRLKRIEQLKNELIATKTPDKQRCKSSSMKPGVLNSLSSARRSPAEATRRTRIGDLLIGFLTDPDWNRRDSAARSPGAMGAREAVAPLRQLVFQPAEESLTRLSALLTRSARWADARRNRHVVLDSSPLIREEADRLLADLEKRSPRFERPSALSNLLQSKQFPATVFDNLIERDIILSLARKVQPVGELAEQIGRSLTTVRRHLALLQNGKVAQASLQSQELPLVASRKNGSIIEYHLTRRGRNLTDFASRAYSRFLKQRFVNRTVRGTNKKSPGGNA